jgi:hypothetical protein
MSGGLGNQAFQYIFARYVEERTGQRVYVDDSFFWLCAEGIAADKERKPPAADTTQHNGY